MEDLPLPSQQRVPCGENDAQQFLLQQRSGILRGIVFGMDTVHRPCDTDSELVASDLDGHVCLLASKGEVVDLHLCS